MTDAKTKRRLAAIVAADVVGYSGLMESDEVGTLRAVSQLIDDVISPLITDHDGRVVKLMGDGILAEFGSVVDAVNCADSWQSLMSSDHAGSLISFRIGVNQGDIITQEDDIFGEGVNIAARLEGLAEPGGICISGAVYHEVRNRLALRYRDLGKKSVKNISEPLRVFAIEREIELDIDLSLPDKPSIAVLPFDNMSGDQDQEYLADGITEDLITALSKVRWLFVIARNSTFSYKGKATDIKQVGRELGVKYVMEGSLRKAGNRVRITAQLIDATNGHHVWAERYDRQIEDIFDLQDEMTQTIIGAVEPEISAVERAQVASKPPENLDAWECFQRGVWHMWSYNQADHENALRYLTKASELDPDFAPAHAYRGYVHYQSVVMHWSKDFENSLDEGMKAARKALAADERDAVAFFSIGRIYMMQGRQDDAIAALQSSISLNPSFAQAHHGLGMALCLAGRLEEAHAACDMCERLSPRDPILWASLAVQALTSILAEDYENALMWAQRAKRHPNGTGYWPHAMMAAPLAHLGRLEEANLAVQEMLAVVPTLTIGELAKTYPTTEPGGLEPYLQGLRLAGLPE
ncbi:MAG: tetratricopeptide repeat protein [Paracoccaceae bacterium]